MVRALADMPPNLAEEALARYSRSVDAHVRSRQGFMVSAGGGWGEGAIQPRCLPASCACCWVGGPQLLLAGTAAVG